MVLTDTARRRALQLQDLQAEARGLEHQRNLLRIELFPVVMTSGWRDPAAVKIVEQLKPIVAEWEKIVEQIRQLRTPEIGDAA